MPLPRILFILHLPPPIHGAAVMGQYVHDSGLINSSFDCRYINLTTAASIEDIGGGGWRKFRHFIELLRQVRRSVRAFKPDLVYITPNACAPAFYKDFIIVQLLKGMHCRIVAHYHNKGVSTRQDRWLDNRLYRRFFRGLKVILLSEWLYADMQRYVAMEDVFIVPNGISVPRLSAPRRYEHEGPVRLLFLSNLIESKGVLVLLDALSLLREQGMEEFVCHFAGAETAEINAERFNAEVAKRGLTNHVRYLGKKYGPDKQLLLRQSDVFVFPTWHDTFGLVLLEAMSVGLPCVSTPEAGIPDVLGDGEAGLLCKQRDSRALADALGRLIASPSLRQRYGTAGQQRFLERFTIETFEERLREVFSKLLGGG